MVVWLVVSVVLLLALSTIAIGVIRMSAAPPAGTTTTVSPPPPPSYSAEQVAAAKKEACDASGAAAGALANSQQNFAAAARDRQSPEYRPALANYQLVVGIETEYLQHHLRPATPKDVSDAINGYIAAVIDAADADTREVSNHDAQAFVDAVNNASAQLDKVCP